MNEQLTNQQREERLASAAKRYFDLGPQIETAKTAREKQGALVNSMIGVNTPLSFDEYDAISARKEVAETEYRNRVNEETNLQNERRIALNTVDKLVPSYGVTFKAGEYVFRKYTSNDQSYLTFWHSQDETKKYEGY